MRRTSCLLALSLIAVTPVFAQLPECKGTYNIVRVSEIQPGKMETFLSAVAAQRTWYAKAGTTDEISLLRIVDPKSGGYSETEALTLHRSTTKPPAHDAAFDAFVALYKQSSSIKTQYTTCETK